MYKQKAEEALSVIPDELAQKVKDGAVSLTEFIGEGNKDLVQAIKNYQSWADKVQTCSEKLVELKVTLRKLELQKFNNVVESYTNQFNIIQSNGIDLINAQIKLLESAGEFIGEGFYETQRNLAGKQLELLQKQKESLTNQFTEALANGVEKGSEEFLEMANILTRVEDSILSCKSKIEEFDNSILNVHWQVFQKIQDSFSNINDEIGDILDLIGDDIDVADDTTGEWTANAITKLGLYAQRYELYKNNVQEYAEAIEKLNSDYNAGKYSVDEYTTKLAELSDQQREAAKSATDAESAIINLNKKRIEVVVSGIQKEIEAHKNLASQRKKELQESQELHEYQKTISEKTKEITDLENLVAELSFDNSLSGRAKLAKAKDKLAKAQEELSEIQYEHSIQEQLKAIDEWQENDETYLNNKIEGLQESLNDSESLISQSFETVKKNSDQIGTEIERIASNHGIRISKTLTDSWKSGEKAIASYGHVLNARSSQFISNIKEVENNVWTLQSQANATAIGLSEMFSVKADRLVNELIVSYTSEEMLLGMTEVLRESLVNTLERGYDVSSITSSFGEITNSINQATAAWNNYVNATNSAPAVNATPAVTISSSGTTGNPVIDYIGKGSPFIGSTEAYDKIIAYAEKKEKEANEKASEKLGNLIVDNLVKRLQSNSSNTSSGGSGSGGLINNSFSGKNLVMTHYASGIYKTPKDEVAITNEGGREELIVNPDGSIKLKDGSLLTPLKRGSTVFNNEQTRRLFELTKNPNFLSQITGTQDRYADLAKSLTPKIEIPVTKRDVNNTMSVGSLITVNGNINDSKEMMKVASKAAVKEIRKSWEEFSSGIYK